jgi:hypothetical protein
MVHRSTRINCVVGSSCSPGHPPKVPTSKAMQHIGREHGSAHERPHQTDAYVLFPMLEPWGCTSIDACEVTVGRVVRELMDQGHEERVLVESPLFTRYAVRLTCNRRCDSRPSLVWRGRFRCAPARGPGSVAAIVDHDRPRTQRARDDRRQLEDRCSKKVSGLVQACVRCGSHAGIGKDPMVSAGANGHDYPNPRHRSAIRIPLGAVAFLGIFLYFDRLGGAALTSMSTNC